MMTSHNRARLRCHRGVLDQKAYILKRESLLQCVKYLLCAWLLAGSLLPQNSLAGASQAAQW